MQEKKKRKEHIFSRSTWKGDLLTVLFLHSVLKGNDYNAVCGYNWHVRLYKSAPHLIPRCAILYTYYLRRQIEINVDECSTKTILSRWSLNSEVISPRERKRMDKIILIMLYPCETNIALSQRKFRTVLRAYIIYPYDHIEFKKWEQIKNCSLLSWCESTLTEILDLVIPTF